MYNKFIVWNETFEVGNSELDGHHKRLIEIINILYEALVDGASEEQVNNTMSEMKAYAELHFRVEEEILAHSDYPHLDDQQKAHEAYGRAMQELRRSSFTPTRALSQDILQFLKEWWLNHILSMDKQYASYVDGSIRDINQQKDSPVV